MKASVIRIGNSRGIRIPKAMLQECGLEGAVHLEVQKGRLVVRPIREPRRGWEDAFRRMAREGDDMLLEAGTWPETRWHRKEWKW